MSRRKTIALIIGGGIGGLATAIALRRAGLVALVFERAPELREQGAGLSLWPNGLRALDALGLGAKVRARSLPDLESALRTWKGRVLVETDGQRLRRTLGDVSLVIHRAELLSLLRAQLPEYAVVSDLACTAVTDSEQGVVAHFADGSQMRGDLLIGADGIGSLVRATLHGERPPTYAGYTAWRAVVRYDHREVRPGVSIGQGRQFGQAPIADGLVYWFATQNGPAGQTPPSAGWRAALLEQFAEWHSPIPDLIAATPESAILHNDVIDRPPLTSWGAGHITLLGDAAHPMTPNLGQGGNQALEDAEALGRALAEQTNVVTALRDYERARIPRANAVVEASRNVGRIMQLGNPVLCWLRDTFLATGAATRMQMKQLQQLVAPAGQQS
jgi:2-polyprenyl-6-methoxyphenol hydroxylase-like FAD-dependent oxidoreductase